MPPGGEQQITKVSHVLDCFCGVREFQSSLKDAAQVDRWSTGRFNSNRSLLAASGDGAVRHWRRYGTVHRKTMGASAPRDSSQLQCRTA